MADVRSSSPDYSILDAFEGPIDRPRTSLLYHGGLALVTATMVLLPLIYLALAGLTAWASTTTPSITGIRSWSSAGSAAAVAC